MLNPETLSRIRRIELRTRRLVNDSFAGAYHSVFKGRGIAFDSVRPYQPGDDVRDIDWNVTARSDEAYVKHYAEERELTVMVVVDSSASSLFGTVDRPRRDLAAEIAAVLALSAISNNDKVGLMIFSDRIEQYVAPRKGRNHVLRLIRELLVPRPGDRGTDLKLAISSLNRMLHKRTIVFLLSDFLAPADTYRSDLIVAGRRHDVIALVLVDPLEQNWPGVGLVRVQDAETGMTRIVNTSERRWRKQFAARARQMSDLRDSTLRAARVEQVTIVAGDDYVNALAGFFRRRALRMAR